MSVILASPFAVALAVSSSLRLIKLLGSNSASFPPQEINTNMNAKLKISLFIISYRF